MKGIFYYSVANFIQISIKTDGRTLWLIELLYPIKSDVLWFIGSKESCMQNNQGHDLRDEKIWSSIRDKQTDIVDDRGAVCYQRDLLALIGS